MTDIQQASGQEQAVRDAIPSLPMDDSRLAMMRRTKRMTVDERLDLFEQLSRDAAWAKGAKRVR